MTLIMLIYWSLRVMDSGHCFNNYTLTYYITSLYSNLLLFLGINLPNYLHPRYYDTCETKGLFIWEEVIPVSEKTFRLAK
jgi:hypothetical protein